MLYAAGSVQDIQVDADHLCGLTWFGQLLWFADSGREQVVGVDPFTGKAVQTHAAAGLTCGLAVLGSNLMYAAGPGSGLVLLDPVTGVQAGEVRNPRPGEPIRAMEATREGVWTGYRDYLDLRAVADWSLVTSISLLGPVSGVTMTDNYLLYADPKRECIALIDPDLEQEVLPINVHGRPTGLAWDGNRVWYCDQSYSRLRAIDVPGILGSR